MGVSTREKGVLKLVHPGRHVEIHREPITAAEIMSKYPRHCIARPDVFKFPYIVVRPESVLLPGKVFYLVPNRTLHNLLKARAQHSQPSSREYQNPHNHDHRGHTRLNSPIKCWGGKTPKRQQNNRGHRRRLQSTLRDKTNSYDQDSEDYTSDTSYVDAWTEITNKIRKVYNISDQASPADSLFDSCRPFRSKVCGYEGDNVTSTLSMVRRGSKVTSAPTVRNGGMHIRSSGDHVELKSCFRKQDNVRKFLNLKVTFASPITIPRSPRGSLSPEQPVWTCNLYNLRL